MGESYDDSFAIGTCVVVIEGCTRGSRGRSKDIICFCWENWHHWRHLHKEQISYAVSAWGYCVVEEEEKGIPLLLGGRRGACDSHKRAASQRLWFASLKRCSINQVWKILHTVFLILWLFSIFVFIFFVNSCVCSVCERECVCAGGGNEEREMDYLSIKHL